MNNQPAGGTTPETTGHEHHELKDALWLWREYGRSLVLGVLLAAVLYIGLHIYRGRRERAATQAAAVLAEARGTEQLEEAVRLFGRTPSGPPALLALAAQHYRDGDFDGARARYEEFLKIYPKHEMNPAAELGRLHALEALGETDAALAGYQAFVAARPGHFLEPAAVFGQARSFEQAGRIAEARATYEDFIAAHPGSSWAAQAEFALAALERTRRASVSVATP